MVHALRSPVRTASHAHPDAKRIAGLAAAISANVALLMLLLVPMQAPPSLALPELRPSLQWIMPTPAPPPVPPVHVPVTAPHAHPRVPPTPLPVAHQAEAPVVDQAQSPFVEQAGADPIEAQPDTAAADGAPLAGATLEYADAPPPAYPRDALRDGVQGVVMLQVLVDTDGRPLQVDIQHSSGDRRLDNAARKQVFLHWRFHAAMKGGRAVQAIGLVPIAFKLQ